MRNALQHSSNRFLSAKESFAMYRVRATPFLRHALFVFLFVFPLNAYCQQGPALTGTVKDSSGKPVAGAQVAVENVASGQSSNTATDSTGSYTLQQLAAGNYNVTVTANGFTSQTEQVTVTANGTQALDFTLAAAPPGQELPNAPSAAPQEPSLQDLGISQQQMQGNPQLQARLNRRTEMLKIHQKLGLITLAPMVAALITGPMAKAKGRNGQPVEEPTQANLDFHAALGSTTAALYFTTAYFAVFAPKVPGVQKRGAIRMHEALAFVHGPGMILTPILGAMAFKQEQDGEKVHGVASFHGTAATVTVLAYGASIVAVSWPIHLKFWETK